MTLKQSIFAQKLKRYFERQADYNYSNVVSKMQRDQNYNDLIVAMTLGRSLGKSSIEKFKYDFSYRPEGE